MTPANADLSAHIMEALQQQPTPALYDAFVGLASLYTTQASLVTGELYAAAAKALVTTETQPGGPYLATDYSNQSLLANAAIEYFMCQLGTPLPHVSAYLKEAQTMLQQSRLKLEPSTIQHLERALVADADTARAAMQKNSVNAAPKSDLKFPAANQKAIYKQIVEACHAHITTLHPELHAPLTTALQHVLAADKDFEISLLSSTFIASLTPKAHGKVSERHREALCKAYGIANIFCWMAYTAYDNIIDKESEAEQQLSMANVAHRVAFTTYLTSLTSSPATQVFVSQVFDTMDAANTWELRHTRPTIYQDKIVINHIPDYGDYSVLAQRSGAHILGPLLLSTSVGFSLHSTKGKALQAGLQHYLIARQLQDDLHDWVDDLKVGQLNAVTSNLLKQLRIKPDIYHISTLIGHLRQGFWESGLTQQCKIIRHHTAAARIAFMKCAFFSSTTHPFLALIDRLEDAAEQAEANYRQYKAFVAHYN